MGLFDKLFKKKNIVPVEMNPESKTDSVEDLNIKPAPPKQERERHKIAGTSFRTKEIMSLGHENPNYDLKKTELINENLIDEKIYQFEFYPSKVELVEEPDNEYDKNAIKVIIDNVHVGYIKKGSCSHIKKLIREDKIKNISAEIKGGKYKIIYDDNEFEDKPKYLLEKDSHEIGISIYITLK